MSYEIVHTIGSTTYLVFSILFFWISRIPRTNPGAIWWAFAMLFALGARLSFLISPLSQIDMQIVVSIYSALNVIEKFLLVGGLIRFFNIPVRLIWFGIALASVEFWILLCWLTHVSPFARSVGIALFNGGALAFAAWASYTNRDALDHRLLAVTALASSFLTVHWLTAFLIVRMEPNWLVHGFLLGTVLVLIQYLSLLAAVLLSFQQRLLLAEAKALDMALLDPLTGLNNQRYVDTLFEKALLLATRPHHLVAVFYIDLDNFKPINDSAGHAAGDQVLKTVASRIKGVTRSTDICARVGGDEFVVVCTQLDDQEQVRLIGDKILGVIVGVIDVAGKTFVLGASIGVSIYPKHGDTLPALLKHADSAMYQVKRSGRSGYKIYEDDQAPTEGGE